MIQKTIEKLKAFKQGYTIELDDKIISDIQDNAKMLIGSGLIYPVNQECCCTLCGKNAENYVLVKGDDGTAMCLNCAFGEELSGKTFYICAVKRDLGKMGLF